MNDLAAFYQGKRVLLTGHTGFKGSWLTEWLLAFGAQVTGLSLPPPTQPALFDLLGLAGRCDHRIGDIRDRELVRQTVAAVKPDVVFHLAAQPLVRRSYEQPVETYATNVMGTVHVLEALRSLAGPCAAVLITTDKVYENRESLHAYRESDPLGGYDPYSSSKAAAELAIQSYCAAFFNPRLGALKVAVASARAGNVVGGGDWAPDRLVPDSMRALARGAVIPVRNPASTRPWQHVLEPLSGYLLLAARLSFALGAQSARHPLSAAAGGPACAAQPPAPALAALCSAFNFGPPADSNRTVRALVEEVLQHWPGRWEDCSDPQSLHEAGLLNLATDKAGQLLGWCPRWGFRQTVAATVRWYRTAQTRGAAAAAELTRAQLAAYQASAEPPPA
ncbi:MAG: CDP-glucose 4,6-dehydratase [Kiritimatiellaeota bacterium]|nr:CDP-glucose 4,6-dehydratase [Kiritimatiellota bacterium]